ncbi:NAD(P)H-dependent oxidoreductase subunit E [Verrucomicrobiaceae bacterium 227]
MSSKIEVPQPRAIDRTKLNYLSATETVVTESEKTDKAKASKPPLGGMTVPDPAVIDRSKVQYLRPKLSVLEQNVHSAITSGTKNFPPFEVTPELEEKSNQRIAQYPADQRRSAVLPLLHEVQHHFGFISPESIEWVAEKLEISPIKVVEVVTFYPGFRQKAPGKFHVRVCRTLSCAMSGSGELMEKLCELTGIDRSGADAHSDPIAVSPCGNYSVEFAECLASCGTAPVCLVNDDFHEGITPEKAQDLLNSYASKA